MQEVLEATPGAALDAEESRDDIMPPRSTEIRDVRLLVGLIAFGSALWLAAAATLALAFWR